MNRYKELFLAGIKARLLSLPAGSNPVELILDNALAGYPIDVSKVSEEAFEAAFETVVHTPLDDDLCYFLQDEGVAVIVHSPFLAVCAVNMVYRALARCTPTGGGMSDVDFV